MSYNVNIISRLGSAVCHSVPDARMAVAVATAFREQGYQVVDITTPRGRSYAPEAFDRLIRDAAM